MTRIHHDDEYYQAGLKSQGVDYTDLSHNEIALYKAIMKQSEADLLIEAAFEKVKTGRDDFDHSRLYGTKKPWRWTKPITSKTREAADDQKVESTRQEQNLKSKWSKR